MGVANVPASAAGGGGLEPYYQKFTSSGTFTLPAGYGPAKPLLVNIQVIGGGGAGSAYQGIVNDGVNQSNGGYSDYFGAGENHAVNHTQNFSAATVNASAGSGGGSGGLAASQLYLTSNLTITVGAAGSRPVVTSATLTNSNVGRYNQMTTATGTFTFNNPLSGDIFADGGNGGISTAGSISATGGTSAASGNLGGNLIVQFTKNNGGVNNETTNSTNSVNISGNINTVNVGGTAGQPAGSAGMATPLLGALAGGAASTTPVYGAYGIGGISTDGATHSGVEGTGGGWGSIGASGAVILTWWE